MNVTKNKEIREKYFIKTNRSPQPLQKLKYDYKISTLERSPPPYLYPPQNFHVEENLEKNININEYLNYNQVNFYPRNKQRSPENNNRNINFNNNYYNYNKNYYPDIAKHFESDDLEDKNTSYNNKEEYNSNNHKNWKKKILQIREQNKEEYEQYINKNYNNYSNNNIYNYNNYYNGNYYSNTFNANNNNNTFNPNVFTGRINLDNKTKKFDNYDNYKNYNKNKNKKREFNNTNKNFHHKDYSDLNKNNYLSDININKNTKYQNQTQENHYKNINSNNINNQNINQNNDSSSSNIYDDSYDYKTQYNFKKNNNNKNKFKNFPKFCSASQDNSDSDNNKEDEAYNTTTPIRPPLKNDEKHYHQNLTIKIQQSEEENKPEVKYVDNTPEGCFIVNNNNEKKNRKRNLSIDNEEIKKIAGKLVQKNKNIEFPKLNRYKNKNDILKINNNTNIDNNNKSSENISNNNNIERKNKKIKEITVDLSPKKKLHLSNSNQNLRGRINRENNMSQGNENKYNFNINPNSKIESCIIKFEKNQTRNTRAKLSNSFDNIDINKNVRYIKKKIISTNNKNYIYNTKETPGNNNVTPFDQNGSVEKTKKFYQKPGYDDTPSPSPTPNLIPTPLEQVENLENSGEVKDYCAPSPNYGKRGKEAYLNSQKKRNQNLNLDLNNNSPLLSNSVKFQYQLFNSGNKKDNTSPFKEKKKYDEFSFRENDNNNNNINDVNYSNGQKIEVNIISNENSIETNDAIKNKNKLNENINNYNQQRMPTFSDKEISNIKENNPDINEPLNKDKALNRNQFIIKSFSNKQKEIKEKPIISFLCFYKKYYDIILQPPQNEKENIPKKQEENNNEIKYQKIEKKILGNKLINAPIRGKNMDVSANNFYIRNKLNSSLNDEQHSSNLNNTIDIELEQSNNDNITSSLKKNNDNKFIIRTIIKKIKREKKKIQIKNINNKINIDISSLLKKEIKDKALIAKEKKINSILKEDFENYIIYYNTNNLDNNKKKEKKYNWSMIELLIIKIKLDIADIINSYLNSCEEIINDEEHIKIGNDYIKNIIEHYKNNYLTNNNYDKIRKKILKIFAFIKDININIEFKYKILFGLIQNLMENELFFKSDYHILKQTDRENENEIKKILESFNNILPFDKDDI